MKKRILFVSSLLACSLVFNSCGVMFGGSKYQATIVAEGHPNAEIYVNGEKTGTGQTTGLYKRNQPLKVEVKQDGCEPKTKNFDNTFRTGSFVLSLVSWGLVGVIIDLGTGASYKPDHRGDVNIEKMSDKNYKFTVSPDCKH